MTQQVWKFQLSAQELNEISMPEGAEVLTVQVQEGKACLWALCAPEAKQVRRTFRVVPTGRDLHFVGAYLGTFQFPELKLVFHVFEEA